MYRGYELLTWESRLVGVAVWNRMLVWINPNLELEAAGDGFDDPWSQESGENKIRGKILDMGQMRAGKPLAAAAGIWSSRMAWRSGFWIPTEIPFSVWLTPISIITVMRRTFYRRH